MHVFTFESTKSTLRARIVLDKEELKGSSVGKDYRPCHRPSVLYVRERDSVVFGNISFERSAGTTFVSPLSPTLVSSGDGAIYQIYQAHNQRRQQQRKTLFSPFIRPSSPFAIIGHIKNSPVSPLVCVCCVPTLNAAVMRESKVTFRAYACFVVLSISLCSCVSYHLVLLRNRWDTYSQPVVSYHEDFALFIMPGLQTWRLCRWLNGAYMHHWKHELGRKIATVRLSLRDMHDEWAEVVLG